MNYKIEKTIKKIGEIGLLILLFLPLFVWTGTLFPYVFWKSIVFRFIIQLLSLLALILLFNNKLSKVPKKFIISSVFIYFILMITSVFFAEDASRGIWGNFERMNGVIEYIHLAAYLLILIVFLRTKQQWQKVFFTLNFSSFLISLMAIAQEYKIINFGAIDYAGRTGGTLGNAAFLSSVLIICTFLLTFFFHQYPKQRKFTGLVIALNILTIFISATRGAILALGFVVILSFFILLLKKNFLSRRKKQIVGALLLLTSIFSVSIFIFKNSQLVRSIEPLRRISEISLEDATSASRLKLWQFSWQAFKERPLTGWGIENYYLAFNKYYDGSMREEWFDRAHNQLLDVLVTGGLITFIAYLVFIIGVFIYLKILYKKNKLDFISYLIFTMGWLAYIIQNLFIFDMLSNLVYVFLFLAFLIYIDCQDQENYLKYYIVKIGKPFKGLIVIIIIIGVVFSLSFLIANPIAAGVNTHYGLYYFLVDFEKSKNYFSRAREVSPGSFGHEEILNSIMKIKDTQLFQNNYDNLDWAINFFEEESYLSYRSQINLSYLYNFKAEFDQQYADKSLELLDKILPKGPNRQDIYYLIGQAQSALGNMEKSTEYFHKALEIRKTEDAYWNLILNYIFFGDDTQIAKYAVEAVDFGINLSNKEIRYLIDPLNRQRQNRTLEILLEKYIERDRNTDTLADLALVKLRLGKEREAMEYAAEALEKDPNLKSRLKKYFFF